MNERMGHRKGRLMMTAAFIMVGTGWAATGVHHNGTWDVPCPSGKPGSCFTLDFVSSTLTFDPPLPNGNDPTVAVWFSGCNAGGGWKHTDCPCCGDVLVAEATNVTANGATLQVSRKTGGGWGQALQVSWSAPGPPAPPPPSPPPPRTTPLSIMMFYGFNETAQCGWTTHAWQELAMGLHDQAFKTNLSVALADIVSYHTHCKGGGFVMVPPVIFLRDGGNPEPGKARGPGLPADWELQLDAFEKTIAPFVHNGSAVGIFLGDEKICQGVPLSNYTAVLAHLRAAFGRSVLLYGNECSRTIGAGQLPLELDLFSFDIYDAQNDDGPSEVAKARAIAETIIFPQLGSHQRLLLVPGVYGNTPAKCEEAGGSAAVCSLEAQATQVVAKLEGFFEWAMTEDRIAGFNSWHFGHRAQPQNSELHDMELGAWEMPAVMAKLRQIGEHIVASQNEQIA